MHVTLNTVISCSYITVTQILLHMTLLFLIYVLLIYGYTISLNTIISYICIIATWILCIQLYHAHTLLLHRFTGIHAIIVSAFLLHESLFILHGLFLYWYSYILVTWLFLVYWYWYSCYWTCALLICDMWN